MALSGTAPNLFTNRFCNNITLSASKLCVVIKADTFGMSLHGPERVILAASTNNFLASDSRSLAAYVSSAKAAVKTSIPTTQIFVRQVKFANLQKCTAL
jgi:hypothetical protein